MTSVESIIFVGMLLDDSRSWFGTTDEVVAAINNAQYRKVREWYFSEEEAPLRTLYERTGFLADGDDIYELNDPSYAGYGYSGLLYPRTCLIYADQNDTSPVAATYLEPHIYHAYTSDKYTTGHRFPRVAYYTISGEADSTDSTYMNRVHFTGDSDARAKIAYVKEPREFTRANPLELPAETHVEICTLAAAIINDMDVGERERGVFGGEAGRPIESYGAYPKSGSQQPQQEGGQ